MSDENGTTERELREENQRLRNTIAYFEEFTRERLGPYVSYEMLERIEKQENGDPILGERRTVTMLFSDIRQSTELSESIDVADYMSLLNHYLGDMIEIIDSWQGNITDFVGDAIVAVFGAPRPNDRAAFQAVGCAVAMQRRMRAVNEWNHEQGYPSIQMGIGIHTGEAILGCVGSRTRMKYDMIGRNVNLASRIEGFTQGGQILISDETLRAAGERVVERPEGAMLVHPKGIQGEVLLHDIIGFGSLRV